MNTPHDELPDEGMIHEWLDGQLDADTSAHFEALVLRSPEFAARVAEARGFVAASSRILSALDDVPAGVLPRTETPSADTGVRAIVSARIRPRTFTWQRWASAAAVLLVAVTGTMLWQRTPESDMMSAAVDGTATRSDEAVVAPSVAIASDSASETAAPEAMLAARIASDGAPSATAAPRPSAAPVPAASAPVAPAPAAPIAPTPIAPAADAVLAAQVARAGRVTAAEIASAEVASSEVASKTAAPARAAAPAETRALLDADAARAPAGAGLARSFSTAPVAATELTTMRSDLLADDLFVAVQRVECTTQCRQIRVEIARDGRLQRWTATLGRSSAPETARVTPAVLSRLTALSDSLALESLPPVVPLMGAQCRTVGSLRESLRLEFRHDGRQRAVTALPWCDAPQHPLAVMARAVEQAATEVLGAP